MSAWIQCANCDEEVTDNIDLYEGNVSDYGDEPDIGEWYHPYYGDVWCTTTNGTKAAPGRLHL